MGRKRLEALASVAVPYGERADETYRRVRDLIVRGRLRPGERVLEAGVALALGVSRTPVREALDRLGREGFLDPISAGRRTQLVVAPLTEQDVHELWTLMGALEGVAILEVSTMGRDRRRQLAAAMAEINDELTRETQRRPVDVDAVGVRMSEFHQVFIDACAGSALATVCDMVRPRVQRYEWAYVAQAGATYKASIDDHRQIVEAVGSGNGARARTLLEQHWHNGIERTVQQLRRWPAGAPPPAGRRGSGIA